MKALSKTGISSSIIAAAVLLFGGTCVATYNKLVRLDQAAENSRDLRAQLEGTVLGGVSP